MTLVDLQSAIAELLCDRRALDAYAADKARWLDARALDPEDQDIVNDLDEVSLRAFQEIQSRDRAYFIEAVLPTTVQRMGDGWHGTYFDHYTYGEEDTRLDVDRFVTWLADTDADAATIDLARYERSKFALLDEPPFAPARGNPPRGLTMARLAPGIAVVAADVHIPTLLDDPAARTIAPQKGAILLRRDEDGVTSAWVDGAAGALLLAIARRSPGDVRALLATLAGQEACAEIVSQGVLV